MTYSQSKPPALIHKRKGTLMDYLLNNTIFELDSPNAQDMLNAAHKVKQRPLCRCTRPMPEMYVARIAG